jgi:hypothetical protein
MTSPAHDGTGIDVVSALARDQSLELSPVELTAIGEAHDRLQARLASARSRTLPYCPDPVEPATALRWIERGGRSVGD